jgi:putative zinc finger protein
MSEIFVCGDQGALVGYLYDECTPAEREAIASHLTRCVSCADEVNGLASTRRVLATWAPPQVELGLQITRKADGEMTPPAGNVLSVTRPQPASTTSWWKAPLPAWAQVAAAMVIFAAGVSVGFTRDGTRGPESRQTAVPSSQTITGPSKEDLAQLEQRLRAEMTQLAHANPPAAAPTPAAARSTDDAIMQRVQTMLDESVRKQNVDFTERIVRQNATLEAQRRADLESISTRIGLVQGQAREQLGQLQQGFNILANRVSLTK